MARVVDPAVRALAKRLSAIIERDLFAALAFLNARTRYRFTGVYRFDPPMLRSVVLFDRENPTLRFGGDTPMRETYCSLLRQEVDPFLTDAAGRDAQLLEPARASVVSYCGVPLLTDDGLCFGSLCHFDPRPRLAPVGELPLLEQAAAMVMRAVARQRQTA